MGKVLKNYPVSTKQQLQKQLSAGMHVHMLNTIRRVFEVGSRVGLSRLMGTKEVTAVGLSRLTLKAYKERLLSNLTPTLYLE
jgi:response regulator of citrate/malate metabolism